MPRSAPGDNLGRIPILPPFAAIMTLSRHGVILCIGVMSTTSGSPPSPRMTFGSPVFRSTMAIGPSVTICPPSASPGSLSLLKSYVCPVVLFFGLVLVGFGLLDPLDDPLELDTLTLPDAMSASACRSASV